MLVWNPLKHINAKEILDRSLWKRIQDAWKALVGKILFGRTLSVAKAITLNESWELLDLIDDYKESALSFSSYATLIPKSISMLIVMFSSDLLARFLGNARTAESMFTKCMFGFLAALVGMVVLASLAANIILEAARLIIGITLMIPAALIVVPATHAVCYLINLAEAKKDQQYIYNNLFSGNSYSDKLGDLNGPVTASASASAKTPAPAPAPAKAPVLQTPAPQPKIVAEDFSHLRTSLNKSVGV